MSALARLFADEDSPEPVDVTPQYAGRALQTLRELRAGYFSRRGTLKGRRWVYDDPDGRQEWEDTGGSGGLRLFAKVPSRPLEVVR